MNMRTMLKSIKDDTCRYTSRSVCKHCCVQRWHICTMESWECFHDFSWGIRLLVIQASSMDLGLVIHDWCSQIATSPSVDGPNKVTIGCQDRGFPGPHSDLSAEDHVSNRIAIHDVGKKDPHKCSACCWFWNDLIRQITWLRLSIAIKNPSSWIARNTLSKQISMWCSRSRYLCARRIKRIRAVLLLFNLI